MARRKQRAPRRAPVYDSEDVEEPARQNEDFKKDSAATDKPLGNNDFRKEYVFQKSKDEHCSTPAEVSETDSELHINESNGPMSDVESSSINIKDQPMKVCLNEGSEKSVCGSDSLEQIKAIYNGFLSNSFWSSPGLNPSQSCTEKRSEASSSSSSSSSPGGNCYDWHQSAVAKTLQQVSEKQLHPQRETNLFSTVQLYRQSARMYGSIFSGASKFHCKSCSASYDTLVDLTVHMNDTGHYRDDNHEKADKGAKSWSKPRKRSLMELEGKEDAQKVLRCMYCGHSFESLQDLSVHMIKTKHYQKVPLKEPGTSIAAAKVIPSFRKRVPVELDITKLSATDQKASSSGSPVNANLPKGSDINKKTSLTDDDCVSNNAQIKSQILKCMECGQSFECLQQLSGHIMLTGHFVKARQYLQKMDKCVSEQISLPEKIVMKNEKTPIQKVSSTSSQNGTTELSQNTTPLKKSEMERKIFSKQMHCKEPGNDSSEEERYSVSSKFDYLTEEDLQESPKMNLDILKSLESTVTSAINKAQKGTPSWGGYQSIHAAYQLRNNIKPSVYNSSIQQLVHSLEVPCTDKTEVSPSCQHRATSPKVNLHAMEELVKKVTQNVAEETRKDKHEQVSLAKQFTPSFTISADRKSAFSSPTVEGHETLKNKDNKITASENNASRRDSKKFNESFTSSVDNAVITVHPETKQPFVSPLNALQSVMNLHLGKAANPVDPVQDPMSMLLKMSNSMAEQASVASAASAPTSTSKAEPLHPDVYQIDKDQPIDLSKGKRNHCLVTASLPGKVLSSLPAMTKTDLTDTIRCTSTSPVHESALSDISDMLRNLSDSHILKSQTPSHKAERAGIEDSHTTNAGDDASNVVHKRKGRHSHWNPQHLLILQAQFTSCLRKTADGKYVVSDLTPQERTVISHVTGLSMTTISHWLANVKYQLRRTGRTKFLKNVDSGHPVFFCSECATQIQTRSTYICHLESHLGFKLQDMAKFSCKNPNKTSAKHSKNILEKTVLSFL